MPPQFATNLRSLYLENNHLNSLPVELTEFVNLQILRIHNNRLPDALKNAENKSVEEIFVAITGERTVSIKIVECSKRRSGNFEMETDGNVQGKELNL